MGDLKSFQVRYLALRKQMIADGLASGLLIYEKDLHTIGERLTAEGTSFVKVTLPQLGKALDQGLVSGTFSCTASFSLKRNTRLPTLFYSLFKNIFGDDAVLLDNPCVRSIRFLRLFLLLDSKLIYEPPSVMKEKAVSDFASRMSSLRM